ncbi:hypothetical protein HJC23_012186 [Cyclotella cryptica]|uniref:SAP domain-containing protein n=1 Tax=Cyclotella cryptica TaxID=29204 RepID=A0ABD3PW28_9STRA|eukprot:CCRYP_011210-RA/>CCRYP_011210-RA protein AED:0.37 eAED:0.37 QI:0/-1/0/1/-1/1/1/0/473
MLSKCITKKAGRKSVEPTATCEMASFSAATTVSQHRRTHRIGVKVLAVTVMLVSYVACIALCRVKNVEAMRIAHNLHAARKGAKSRVSLHTTSAAEILRRSIMLYSFKDEDNDGDGNAFRQKQFRQQYPIGMASSDSSRPANKSTQSSYARQSQQYQLRNEKTTDQNSFITSEMERQVAASARATLDSNTVSRAISSLVVDEKAQVKSDSKSNKQSNSADKTEKNTLRYLAGKIRPISTDRDPIVQNQDNINNNSWDTQQIAIASGATTFLLSPVIIPIIHSLIPPLLPFPSSISFEGAAFLGALAYILALGDPTDQSNLISKTASGGILGDGVEVTGAVSRIVGRTALQSVQTSAPRLKAVARAVVDYDSTVNSMEEMKQMQYQLSRRLLELESENEILRREVALWNAVEDVSGVFKLEELKEMARVKGLRGYSSDGKAALLRRLVKERVVELDLTPYYQTLDTLEERLDSA